jgi:putative hemolysin
MPIFIYSTGVLALTIGLVVFSYFDRTYRELGRVHPGRTHQHLDTFESDVEPRLHMERRRAALGFSLLARFWLVFVAAITARGVLFFVPGTREAALELIFFLGAEVVIAMQFFPALLLARAPGNWVLPLVPVVRTFLFIIWPVQAVLELLISVLHLSEESEEAQTPAAEQQQAIEALVDAATEEGIIEQDEARLIESVVEFGDKRVRDVMTPRPDVIAIRADASLEELRDLVVETKFSRLPVFEKTLDDISGIVMARDMLEVPDREAAHRTVRELMRPALFVPETKFGSELLKEMQRKNQQMAVVIDEYGLMAGLVTIEDLVEEIVGEIGEEDRTPAPDVVREASGALIIRGSVQLEKVSELFGVQLDSNMQHSAATTIAGLLNSVAGHVPRTGEVIDADGLRFEVIEANQRKVLRVRAKPIPNTAANTARTV